LQAGSWSVVVSVAELLCGQETEGAALSDKSWLQVILATLDFALPQMCNLSTVAVADLEGAGNLPDHACRMSARMLQQLRAWLLSRPALKPHTVGALLRKDRLLRWWACLEHLGRVGAMELASQVVLLLLSAVTNDGPPTGGSGAGGELSISPAEAGEVRAARLAGCAACCDAPEGTLCHTLLSLPAKDVPLACGSTCSSYGTPQSHLGLLGCSHGACAMAMRRGGVVAE
jgi:hypothetical protein